MKETCGASVVRGIGDRTCLPEYSGKKDGKPVSRQYRIPAEKGLSEDNKNGIPASGKTSLQPIENKKAIEANGSYGFFNIRD